MYTYSLCIYEYILILCKLVNVRNSEKKSKEKKNPKFEKSLKRCDLVDHLAARTSSYKLKGEC